MASVVIGRSPRGPDALTAQVGFGDAATRNRSIRSFLLNLYPGGLSCAPDVEDAERTYFNLIHRGFGHRKRYAGNPLQRMIHDALFQMMQSNGRAPSHLEGGAFCASFEVPPTGIPWVQAKNGVINACYPFELPPSVMF